MKFNEPLSQTNTPVAIISETINISSFSKYLLNKRFTVGSATIVLINVIRPRQLILRYDIIDPTPLKNVALHTLWRLSAVVIFSIVFNAPYLAHKTPYKIINSLQ